MDRKLTEILRNRFVSVAVDGEKMVNRRDAEGEFYRKILIQDTPYCPKAWPNREWMVLQRDLKDYSPEACETANTNILVLTVDPEGKALAYWSIEPQRWREGLEEAARNFKPAAASKIEPGRPDAYYGRALPAGGLSVSVTSKVLKGPEAEWTKGQLGLDYLWVRKDEAEELARGRLADSLKARIVRFHLPCGGKLRDLTLTGGRLSGSVLWEQGGARWNEELLGFIQTKDGKVVAFDAIVRKRSWAADRPEPASEHAVAFALADPAKEPAARLVWPGGARHSLDDYLR